MIRKGIYSDCLCTKNQLQKLLKKTSTLNLAIFHKKNLDKRKIVGQQNIFPHKYSIYYIDDYITK